MREPATLHATTVAIDGRGVLIEGPSGSGKSDLALRLIDRGALLVADDRTVVTRAGTDLIADVPDRIAGLIEVRGLGLVPLPFVAAVPLWLVVRLGEAIERLPETATTPIDGVMLPLLRLAALEASAPIKVELAVRALAR